MSGIIDHHGLEHRAAGSPGGGQFTGRRNSAPTTNLVVVDSVEMAEFIRRRQEQLAADGYAPAVAGRSMAGSPLDRSQIETWWDEQFRRSEIRAEGPSYLQMPDDYTPQRSKGRALSGHRRTYRKLYKGAGIAVRMPSATAIRRFSEENGHETFDIPVQAEGNAGTVIAGHVRVTQVAPGKWSTQSIGMPPKAAAKISEAVNAILESRRPSLALREAGDLLERRRERAAQTGARMQQVERSTWINSAGYNREAGEMVVDLAGRRYSYKVPEGVYEAFTVARSPGAAYNELVKGRDRTPVASCDVCRRAYNPDRGHACVGHRPASSTLKVHNERVRAYVMGKPFEEPAQM